MPNVIAVSPFRCRMWDLHDRFEGSVSEDTCKAEIESFSRHGQLVPVIGRPLRGDHEHDIELICGARRLFVARHLNQELTVELREMNDREALIAMDTENRLRVDISPYERGMSYARWLRSGHFQSQDDIARALKVSPAQVSRLLKLARLPTVVVDAFPSPLEIYEAWGLELIEALDDPSRRQATIAQARTIRAQSPRPAGKEVYRQLLSSSACGRRPKARSHDEVVKDEKGQPQFRIRQLRNCIALLLPIERVSTKTLTSIRQSLPGMLSPTPTPSPAASSSATTDELPRASVA